MKSIHGFVIKPKGNRYNNTKNIGGKDLIVNTEIFNHQYVNREAEVISCPMVGDSLGIEPGDTVIVHHNVFRRWHDVKGVERNSKSYFNEETYIVNFDQIFLYRRSANYSRFKQTTDWIATNGFSFIKPIKSIDEFDQDNERPLVGIVKYSDGTFDKGNLVGVRPNSKYEFIIDGERLYRVMNNFVTIKYEYQGDEEEYNPSWA